MKVLYLWKDYDNCLKFFIELNTIINKKLIKDFNIFNIPENVDDVKDILKNYKNLFKKRSNLFKKKLTKIVDEVIKDIWKICKKLMIMKMLKKIKCLFGHTGGWKQIGIAHNGFGDTLHQRTCKRCGKVQNKVF